MRAFPVRLPALLPVLCLLGCSTVSTKPVARTTSHFPSDAEVLAIIKQRVEEKRSAGIVVGLLESDGRKRVVAFGDPGPGQPPLDRNSVFEIGSVTKVFTGIILAQMVKEGRVALDDPVQKYLPSTVKLPSRNGKQITLGHLSEQTSGLPRTPSNFRPADPNDPFADYSVDQMFEYLATHELARDPGAQFAYSNTGVGLLGYVLALREGVSYEQLVERRITKPLGMSRTSITLTPWQKEHLAVGHHPTGEPTRSWTMRSLEGAGALRSTADDMLKFAEANLHPERGVLQEAMAFAHQYRTRTSASGGIGLNWMRVPACSPTDLQAARCSAADTIVWHNGGTTGHRTFFGLLPSKKVAVVILTNSGGAGADDIGYHLLAPTMPLAPKPQPATQRTAIDLPVATLARYVGRYQLLPQMVLDVTLADGALHVEPTGQSKVRLSAESAVDFFVQGMDAQLTFQIDSAGAVTGLIFRQGGQRTTAPRIK